jgi:SAM-dependent methyltransferase
VAAAIRLITDGPYRRIVRWRWLGAPPGCFQANNFTLPDRYPRTFAAVRALLPEKGALAILSYGCSTGEEAIALARTFPDARIRGLDINSANIRRARNQASELKLAGRISFGIAADPRNEPAGAYDAIFCMAVFCSTHLRRNLPPRSEHYLRFEDVEERLGELSRALKPAGLLVFGFSNFRFEDTKLARGFQKVGAIADDIAVELPIYGRDGALLLGHRYKGGIYRKAAALTAEASATEAAGAEAATNGRRDR